MATYLSGGQVNKDALKAALRKGTIEMHFTLVTVRRGLQEQGHPAAAGRRRGLPALSRGHPAYPGREPETTTASEKRQQTDDEPFCRPRLQDHDRSVRGPARLHPRLLGHAAERARTSGTSGRSGRSAWGACFRCTPTSARRSRRCVPGTSPPSWGSRTWSRARRSADKAHADRPRVHGLPGTRDLRGHRAEDEGGPGEALGGAHEAGQGGPHLQDPHRRRHGPDAHLGHGRAPPRDHRGPAAARVRCPGQRGQAPGRLPGDHHAGRQGRGEVHPPDGRPRPVRPRETAQWSRCRGERLRVREQDHRAARSRRSTSQPSRRASSRRRRRASWRDSP